MRNFLVSIAVLLAATVGYAGFQAYNGTSDLKIFDKLRCGAGLTCTRTAGGVLQMVSSPTIDAGDITLNDGTAQDAGLLYDGNAVDFNITLDDSVDDLVIGLGLVAGTTDAIRVDGATQNVTIVQGLIGLGADPLYGFLQNQVASTTVAITASQCGSTFVSNSADVMTLPEASTVLGCRLTFVCGTADDFDVNPADGTDIISPVNSVAAGTGAAITPSAGDAIRCTDIGSSIVLEAVGNDRWVAIGVANGAWTDVN